MSIELHAEYNTKKAELTLGEKIRHYRTMLGLTQSQLGKRLKWPDSRIGAYERNENKPRSKNLKALSEALEVDMKELEGKQ